MKETDNSFKGKVKIQPQENPDAYGFDHMYLSAEATSDGNSFELSKINDDIYYYDHITDTILFSPLYRLGSPLYSQKVKYAMLLYQYLPVLRNYSQYNPVLGKKEIVDGKEIQEIVFDILEYDFHVRFWIDVQSYDVKKIISIQKNGDQSGKIIYNVKNIYVRSTKAAESSFQILNQNHLAMVEYSTSGPVVGDLAPQWKLKSVENDVYYSLDQYKGKIVIIDFWATWCEPCLESMPRINDLSNEFKDHPVNFIGISFKDNGNPLEYIRKKKLTYTFLSGNEKVDKDYGLADIGIPTLFIIDTNGRVADFESGYHGETTINRLRKKINALILSSSK